jgi:DUF4097 and DUF4098 domain-containing protein YvlB
MADNQTGVQSMVRSTIVGLVVVMLVAKAVTGLSSISTSWEEEDRKVSFPSEKTKAFEVTTANGTVDFTGEDDRGKAVEIVAHCKAGASTSERAQEALKAVEVTTEGKETETCRIGWRWSVPRQSDWSANVDFTIRAPKNVNLRVESHNGRIFAKNLVGDAKISTHNGQIHTDTAGQSLDVETDNGEIVARFPGQKIHLHSHNGRISADLSDSHSIEGTIGTQNGLVKVTVGKQTSCELVAKTHHGWRNRKGGKLGSGGGKLVVTSHNGAVLINDPKHDSSSDNDDD